MTTTETPCSIPPEMGSGLIGFIVCLSLYGVTLAQTVVYFRRFSADVKGSKFLVSFLCVVDTLHVCMLSDLFWFTLVTGRVIGASMVKMPWQLMASLAVSFSVTFIVQGFFCLRVRQLDRRNRVATGIIAVAALAQLGSGMVFVAHSIMDRSPQDIFEKIPNWSFKTELVASLLCDVTISGSLIHYFHINKGLSKRIETILQKLIILSINQGVLLGLVTIATLVLLYKQSGTFLAMPSQFILSKLYVNCLLATLNSRKQFRDMANQEISLSLAVVSPRNSIDDKGNA